MVHGHVAYDGCRLSMALGMREQWCLCGCCWGPGWWWRPATAVGPAVCGPLPARPGCICIFVIDAPPVVHDNAAEWSDCAAGVQCTGHEGAVVSLCMLPGPRRLVASCDSSGACLVWSTATGARLCSFAEAGNPSVQASHSTSAWSRQHSAGKQLNRMSSSQVLIQACCTSRKA